MADTQAFSVSRRSMVVRVSGRWSGVEVEVKVKFKKRRRDVDVGVDEGVVDVELEERV